MAKKRMDHSSTGGDTTFTSPFGALAHLRADLPTGEPVVDAAVAPQMDAKDPFGAKLVIRLERKGRGGKSVTMLEGLVGDAAARQSWAQQLKTTLGCGAKWEHETLVLQGDQGDRLRGWLAAHGATRIVGGTR